MTHLYNFLGHEELEEKSEDLFETLENGNERKVQNCARELRERYGKVQDYIMKNLEVQREPISLYIEMLIELNDYYSNLNEELKERHDFDLGEFEEVSRY